MVGRKFPSGGMNPANHTGSWYQNLDLERIVFGGVLLIMAPFILGAIGTIIGTLAKLLIIGCGIMIVLHFVMKMCFPCTECSIPDFICTTFLSAGFCIPDFILAGISKFMGGNRAYNNNSTTRRNPFKANNVSAAYNYNYPNSYYNYVKNWKIFGDILWFVGLFICIFILLTLPFSKVVITSTTNVTRATSTMSM